MKIAIESTAASGNRKAVVRGRWQTGEYIELNWECSPTFYAVRGHVPPEQAAAAVNAAQGTEFKAEDFCHRFIRTKAGDDGAIYFGLCRPAARFRIAVTAVRM